jgi:hypothetical protein
VAVDTGPDVVNRKAARLCGRNASERNAIVIDQFFDTKQKALAWAKAHPHCMAVQVLTPGTQQGDQTRSHKISKVIAREYCNEPESEIDAASM